MAVQYSVTSGLVSIAASVTGKVGISLACGTTVAATLIAMDISFDGVATGAGAIPIRVQLCRTSTVSSTTGAAATPSPYNSLLHAAVTTARIGDTVGGTLSPNTAQGIAHEWLVSQNGGMSYQWPLGREFDIPHSGFAELRLTTQAGMTTCNYVCNWIFEE